MAIDQKHKLIRKGQKRAPTECYGVAAGTTVPEAAVCRAVTAPTTRRSFATVISACGLPYSSALPNGMVFQSREEQEASAAHT